jgi:hypothetical protein
VEALYSYKEELTAGGEFTQSGAIMVNYIARWNGSTWQPLGSGTSGNIYSLSEFQGDLYITGEFQSAGGKASARIARWSTEPVSVSEEIQGLPGTYALYQNYPNPFNPTTTIRFSVSEQVRAKVIVYDLLGREITTLIDGVVSAGTYTHVFTAEYLSSGTYIVRLYINGRPQDIKRMTLLR